MSTKAIKPGLADWLRLLAGSRLQTQVSRSGVLVGGALGVMAVDVAVALIVIGGGGAYDLSVLALLLLGCSFGLAMRALLLAGAEDAGPSLAAMRRAREAEERASSKTRCSTTSKKTSRPTTGPWPAKPYCSNMR